MFSTVYQIISYSIIAIATLVIAIVMPASHRHNTSWELPRHKSFFEFILSPGFLLEIGMWIPFLYVAWLLLSLIHFRMQPTLYKHQRGLFLATNLMAVATLLIVGYLFASGLKYAN